MLHSRAIQCVKVPILNDIRCVQSDLELWTHGSRAHVSLLLLMYTDWSGVESRVNR